MVVGVINGGHYCIGGGGVGMCCGGQRESVAGEFWHVPHSSVSTHL